MDFNIKTYQYFINVLNKKHFQFHTFQKFLEEDYFKSIILRHDVDKLPQNSLRFAQIQHELGIRDTYYFRMVPQSFDEKIIEEIAGMGHEIGFHYEDVSLAAASSKFKVQGSRFKGEDLEKYLVDEAIELFAKHLEQFRKICPVKTICMHGSPLSRWDSRLLWKYYDYRDFGITGEPYFDLDFEEVLYLTDTGRRWNGDRVSVRDRVVGSKEYVAGSGEALRRRDLETERRRERETKGQGDGETVGGGDFVTKRLSDGETKRRGDEETRRRSDEGTEGRSDFEKKNLNKFEGWKVKPMLGSAINMTQKAIDFQNKYNFRSTNDIIRAAENNELPDKIMFTFHPQRWSDKLLPWVSELIWQNTKNIAKYFLIKSRS